MVGFRAFVAGHAGGLNGTVANRPDGSVECVVEGPADAVDHLVDLLRRGPSHARVDEVDVLREPYRGDLPPFVVTA
jgi:acylphosphatase